MVKQWYFYILVDPKHETFELGSTDDLSTTIQRAPCADRDASFYLAARCLEVLRLKQALRKLLASYALTPVGDDTVEVFALSALERVKSHIALLARVWAKPWVLVQGVPLGMADVAANALRVGKDPGTWEDGPSLLSRRMDNQVHDGARILEPSQLLSLVASGQEPGEVILRGAVVKWSKGAYGRIRVAVRDSDYQNTADLDADIRRPAEPLARGMLIQIRGALGAPAPQWDSPLITKRVFRGTGTLHTLGTAPGLRKRQRCAERVRRDVEHRRVQLQRCDTLYVVTRQNSEGHNDVLSELAKRARLSDRLPAVCTIRNCKLLDPRTIAAAMLELVPAVTEGDVVLAVRGGGEWLDHFEDSNVIEALGQLALKCPTYVAVGHARDELSLLDGIVLQSFNTPGVAIQELDELLLRAARTRRERRVDVKAEVVGGDAAGNAETVVSVPPSAANCESSTRSVWHEPVVTRSSWSTAQASPLRGDPSIWHGSMVLWVVLAVLTVLVVALGSQFLGSERFAAPSPTVAARAPDGLGPSRSEPLAGAGARSPRREKDIQRRSRNTTVQSSAERAAGTQVAARADVIREQAAPGVLRRPDALGDALRRVESLIGPFEIGRDLAQARQQCALRHGMWNVGSAERCRLPAGREYQFGVAGGLVQTITLRQLGDAPVPLLSTREIVLLQDLDVSGYGPWALSASSRHVTVRPRAHHPGL